VSDNVIDRDVDGPIRRPSRLLSATAGLLPLTLGVAMTLALAGYRFGESNHAVYLVDALRHNDPSLLANDWWTRSTLQYHFVFTRVSAWLMRLGWIEPGFLVAYLALTLLLHVAWRRLVLALGGCDSVYLASVILYQLMAAGTGLGMYQFLQDSSLLPSNIANVAMLWGVYLWIRRQTGWAGTAFGIAGLFHLNHALAGIGLWVGLTVLAAMRRRLAPSPRYSGERAGERGLETNGATATPSHKRAPQTLSPALSHEYTGEGVVAWLTGTALLIGFSAPAILPAVKSVLAKTASLPLAEFVSLYVRLRHPHHYDPSSWPATLWLTFLIPLAAVVPAYQSLKQTASRESLARAGDASVLFILMLCLALLCAGIWYVSEPLIQMSLYRFSIYPKLLSCVAAGWLIWRSSAGRAAFRGVVFGVLIALTVGIACSTLWRDRAAAVVLNNAFPVWLFALFASVALLRPRVTGWGRPLFAALASTCVLVSLALSWHKVGLTLDALRGDDPGYMEVCDWARRNTPADAVFLVPPDEQSFRLHGERAIVVNYKNVPQLSGELGEWRHRLEAVLDLRDIRALPRPFPRTLDAIRARYASLPPHYLRIVARRYGARYVLTLRSSDAATFGPAVFSDSGSHYFLYDLDARNPAGPTTAPTR
jgi:hypothetical protein